MHYFLKKKFCIFWDILGKRRCSLISTTILKVVAKAVFPLLLGASTLCGATSQISTLERYGLRRKDIKRIKPFLIPDSHPLKGELDAIFNDRRPTEDLDSLLKSGFIPLFFQRCSMIIVVSHPALKGYLVKLNLDSEPKRKKNIPSWIWLVTRLEGARSIRAVIEREKIKYFIVPQKWLYVPHKIDNPLYPQKELIVIEEKMNLVSRLENHHAWKRKITRKHLRELHLILEQALPITPTAQNIPHTKNGLFAFIDTEVKHKSSHTKFEQIRSALNMKMQQYWDSLEK